MGFRPPLLVMKKKLEYNQTQFLGCIDGLAHTEPINANYSQEIEFLYKLINGELIINSDTIMELDMNILDRLGSLIEEYYTSGKESKTLFAQLIKVVNLKTVLDEIKVKQLCVTDQDFF